MVTTTGLALFSLAVVLLTRIYVSFNPPDFLRQYRDPDGNYCGTSSGSSSGSSNSPFRRYYHLRPQVMSENLAGKEGQEQIGHEEEDEKEGERGHDEHWDKHEDEIQQERFSPVPKPEDDRHTIHVIPKSGGAMTNVTSFASKQQGTTGNSDELAILHQLRNPASSPSSSLLSHLPAIPTTIQQQQQQQPHRQWLDLQLSSIHYYGSLEPFGTDDEVLKTIQDLQTGSHNSSSHRRNCHNGGGGRNPSEFARRSSLTVIWENGQWCCLEGRTLYVLKAVGWNGRIRARVLVDQGAGATL